MSLVKIDREEFLLIKYGQEYATDVNGLKAELMAESERGHNRDTILEFTTASAIYSMEIGVIVQYLKTINNTKRILRFVASNDICEMLVTININKIPNIAMYNSLDALQPLYPEVDLNAI
jgi:hypothetical protein